MKKVLLVAALFGFCFVGTNAFACPCHEHKAPAAEENSGCGCNHDGQACNCGKDGKSCECGKDGQGCNCGEASCSCHQPNADKKEGHHHGCGHHHG